jgi:tetrahydromethanopterin S-methyltransferase subunit G
MCKEHCERNPDRCPYRRGRDSGHLAGRVVIGVLLALVIVFLVVQATH